MRPVILLLLAATILGCNRQQPGPAELSILSDTLILNPSGYSPLAAELQIRTNISSRIRLRVQGKHGSQSDVVHQSGELAHEHQIPVLGLYPGYDNLVEVSILDSVDQVVGMLTYSLRTDSLTDDYPRIELVPGSDPRAPGMTLVSYFGHNSTLSPQRPFIFDRFGDIRWALDFRGHPQLGNLYYDNGIERLNNGNLYFANARTNRVYEVNMLGEVLNTWGMPGFGFHHDVLELPDGNFLVSVNKQSEATVEDWIIEIDRNTGQIITTWDLRQSLDQHRTALTTDSVDWIHVNGLAYDPGDDCIILSGRTQGVVKLTRQNEVVWILAPHVGWATAGNGANLNDFLLQPLDKNGQPITDQSVTDGSSRHPDFDWAWYQHAPKVLEDGSLLLFDNGHNRQFGASDNYSRAVIYDIDATNMTIREEWAYGRDRGEEAYSFIVSDADFHPESNSIIMSPGAVQGTSEPYGKVVEVDRTGGEVLFEATIIPPIAALQLVTFHRTERVELYW